MNEPCITFLSVIYRLSSFAFVFVRCIEKKILESLIWKSMKDMIYEHFDNFSRRQKIETPAVQTDKIILLKLREPWLWPTLPYMNSSAVRSYLPQK